MALHMAQAGQQLRRCSCTAGGGGALLLQRRRSVAAAAAAPRNSSGRSAAPGRAQQRQRRSPMAVLAEAPQADAATAREARQNATRRIKALGAQRKLKEAIAELAGLAKLGVEPDTQAATALVAACAQAGNMEMAESVFEQLFADFLEPDEVTFAVLLRGYGAKSPPQWGAIDATLTRMRSRYGLEPAAVSYNALLEICVRTDDTDRAMDVIDRMADDGVEPDEFTVAAVARKRNLRAYLRKAFSG